MATQLDLRPEQWRDHDVAVRGPGLQNLGLECLIRRWSPTSRRKAMLPFLCCSNLLSIDGMMPWHLEWRWVLLCPLTQVPRFPKHPQRQAQRQRFTTYVGVHLFFQASWHSVCQVSTAGEFFSQILGWTGTVLAWQSTCLFQVCNY